jgi:hypothetical protein
VAGYAAAAEGPGVETGGNHPVSVYKSVDADGKVTYSAHGPKGSVSIEEIAIEPRPSVEAIENRRRRYRQISEVSLALSRAREKRQAEREEKEMKRLERLAWQQMARPRVYERTVHAGWYRAWWPAPGHHRRPGYWNPSAPRQSPGPLPSTPLHPGRRLK